MSYSPKSDRLRGVATIEATAKQGLSSFNLDLVGLTVRSVRVGGVRARWTRKGGELTIVPRAALRAGRRFQTVVAYDGVPVSNGESGFIPTADGALIAGEPDVAATWFPVNDHPSDTATYSFRITVPRGLEAIANGELASVEHRGTRSIWHWEAREPLAPYLATASIGQFELRSYEVDGIKYWDAIDPDLLTEPKPRTGARYALTGIGQPSYKRLSRTLDVPAGGATLSFWVHHETEPAADFFLVEARTAGGEDWTTLPDREGHATRFTGFDCARTLKLHPFLRHYQTARELGDCSARGTTGTWWAVSGANRGYERWTVDLARYAGRSVEVSLTSVSDRLAQFGGVFVDDISVSSGPGSTSFEADADPLDGWTVPGAPAGSPANPNDWIGGTVQQAPPSVGTTAQNALARQPEILGFLAGLFGPYPFSAAGSIVDDVADLGFALETQTRPIYSPAFFSDTTGQQNERVVVHELAHQWVGDSLAVAAWRDIWLNEGFASYTEWLWSEHEGQLSAQAIFDAYARTPGILAGLEAQDRRPRPEAHARLTDLHARRDDPARAAQAHRRPGVLPAPAPLDRGASRAERVDRAVHRARRTHLGQATRHVLPHLALHAPQAGGHQLAATSRRVLPSVERDSIAAWASAARSSGKRWPITVRVPAARALSVQERSASGERSGWTSVTPRAVASSALIAAQEPEARP